MVTFIQTQLGQPVPMGLPCVDSDGDCAILEFDTAWKWCAGQYWSNEVDPGIDPEQYMQANGMNEIAWMALTFMAEDFKSRHFVGWGELQGTSDAAVAQNWEMPAIEIGVG